MSAAPSGTVVESLRQALREAFAADARVHLLGEDLLDPYGGAFKVSAGLSTGFPDRVHATPICEAAIAGIAIGMAMRGLRPVAEIMFGDFLTLCADQLINHAAKFHAMYAGRVEVPLVVRAPVGGGRGYGPTHSQTLDKLFLGIPHLVVVMPGHVHDPGRLLTHAILNDRRVVLFLEPKLLYPLPLFNGCDGIRIEKVTEPDDYETAVLYNYQPDRKPDVTLVATGALSRHLPELLLDLAAEEIRVRAVVPACLSPAPLGTLAMHVEASGRAVVAEEGTIGYGWSDGIAAALSQQLFGRLAAPILRVAGAAEIIPAARPMEDEVIVTRQRLYDAIVRVLE